MTPAESILEHLAAVREAFAQAPGPSGAWSRLQVTCPALTDAVPLNTFRVVAPVVLATVDSLNNGCATPSPTPKTFAGWSVQTDSKGYRRLHKRHGGKVLSVYIGKIWNEAKATARIGAKVLD